MPVVTDYTALLGGNYWSGIEVTGRPVIVTYSFPTSAPAYDSGVPGFTGATLASFQAFTAAQQIQARAALADWAAVSGVIFLEVAPGQGDINFQAVDLNTTANYAGAGGIGFEPFGAWDSYSYPQFNDDLDFAGDVFMNTQLISGGVINYGTLLHEIGHVLGLKHPTEIRDNFAAEPDVSHDQVLSADDPALTIMATVGGTATLKQLDIDAAAFIYGSTGGAVVTGNASGANAVVASWSWNAAAMILTQTGFEPGDDIIRGASVTDIISGLGGNDRLFGLAGNDTLTGGAGNDALFGGSGADDMTGGAGDDAYYADNLSDAAHELFSEGYDSVFSSVSFTLGADFEYLQLFGANLTGNGNDLANTIFGDGASGNTLNGQAGADYIGGGAGGDVISGGENGDFLYGGGGADFVYGGNGDDALDGGAGSDRIDGGAGVDTIDYGAAGFALYIDLRVATQANTGGLGTDVISTIENLRGGAFADVLIGTTGANVMFGGAGADALVTVEGDDYAYGEAGDDYVAGRDGNDTLFGGDDRDVMDGGTGIDYLSGGAGDDYLIGGTGNDVIFGGDGGANIGDGGDRWLGGDAGDDVIYGNLGTDRLSGGTENDTLTGGEGFDYMTGEAGIDTFVYNAVTDGTISEQIGDWQGGIDKLRIDASAFGGGLVAGALAANRLVIGTVANQAFGQFLYNAANGVLSWDADGTGAGSAVAFTRLFTSAFTLPPATLAAADFDIVV